MKKQIISLGLATTLILGSVAFATGNKNADNVDENETKEVINVGNELEKESNYIVHSGKITEVNKVNETVSILVDEKQPLIEGEEERYRGAIKFNINEETLVLSDNSQDNVEVKQLKEGDVVEVFYSKDSPMTKSLPPMINADVIILREATEEKALLGVKVEKFDENLVSIDNFLKLNITEDTIIVDRNGDKLTQQDIKNERLVVFYGPATTMSIPAQSNAVKIIAIDKPEEVNDSEGNIEPIKVTDKIILNGEELSLTNLINVTENRYMIPLREVGEKLGYEISWNKEARQAELIKGNNFLTVTENKDMYGFSKMIVKLGMAPVINSGTMYVPVEFIEEVMQLNIEVTNEGILSVK